MAKTGLARDEAFERHLTGAGHPERPQRLAHLNHVLETTGLAARCVPVEPVTIDDSTLLLNHTEGYIARVREACTRAEPFIDVPDSAICPDSFDVARLAAGTLINAVDGVMAGRLDNAFCAVRPPGHHAERDRSMGFCLFNSVALAARHLLRAHSLSRVVILDWDVHHGNGTQHTFEDDPRVLFISLHGHPGIVYPGTGYQNERGIGPGEGFTVNVPILPPGRDDVWRTAFDEVVLPAIASFEPEFVLLSAGFDGHVLDPLAPLELESESYGWMTSEMLQVAADHCGGKLVSTLEGGYDLTALGESATQHLERLLEA